MRVVRVTCQENHYLKTEVRAVNASELRMRLQVYFEVYLMLKRLTCSCSATQNLCSCCRESCVSLPEITQGMGSRSRHALHGGCTISNNEGDLKFEGVGESFKNRRVIT